MRPVAMQSGFSLIEVLVTLVVLSIGLLSLAALQIITLKNNAAALSRSEATLLAYEALDRMRANRLPALQGDYVVGMDDMPVASTDLASHDLAAWKAALSRRLTAGAGSIMTDGRLVTVTVQWLEQWDRDLGAEPAGRVMRLAVATEL